MGAALKRGPCLFTWVIDAWQNERGPAPSDESPTLPAEEVIQAKTKSPVAYTPPGAQLQSTSGGRTLKVSPSPARKPTVHFFTRVQYNACVTKETGTKRFAIMVSLFPACRSVCLDDITASTTATASGIKINSFQRRETDREPVVISIAALISHSTL